MPRPNPHEIRIPVNYSKWGTATFTQTGSSSIHTYYRTYSGGEPTPGYPRSQTFHSHNVSLVKVVPGLYQSLRHNRSNQTQTSNWIDCVSGPAIGSGLASMLPSGSRNAVSLTTHVVGPRRISIERAMDAVVDQKVNLAQAFAERARTVSLIEDTANRLGRAIRHVRAKNYTEALYHLGFSRKEAAKRTRQMKKDRTKFVEQDPVAADWLALQYGWKPLLSDVKGAAEKLAQTHLTKPPLIRAVGKAKASEPAEYRTRYYQSAGDLLPIGTFSWTWTEKLTVAKTELRYQVTNEFLREGKSLGITDPLTLAWELVPYSFVVDWFIPIGDFLRRLNYDSGLQYVGGYSSQHTSQRLTIDALAGNDDNGWRSTLTSMGACSRESVLFTRDVWSSPPVASFPRFEDPFTPTRALNAIALMAMAFQRSPSRFR